MSKFKQGDILEFLGVEQEMFFNDFTIGDQYVFVEDHGSDSVKVRDMNGDMKVHMLAVNFAPTPISSYTYKAGDTVEVVGFDPDEQFGQHHYTVGDKVTIISVDPEDGGLHVIGDTYEDDQWLTPDEVKPINTDVGSYIIWSPESTKKPTTIFKSGKQARYVARQMLEEHGGTWYVLRAETKYSEQREVVKETL